MVFVSFGVRLRVEVEALNMVEALGAYVRHRTVSVLRAIRTKEGKLRGYDVLVVPAVSGQSLANGYERLLVELAVKTGLPVCDECRDYERRQGFTKRATSRLSHDELVRTCVVEDITGFLLPEAGSRRTSPVSFSYLVPDVDSAKPQLDSQFHVRYNFVTGEHQPFNVESGTAIYMLSVTVDVDRIGKLETGNYVNDRPKRIEIAFKALEALIEGFGFGAKKSRYLPALEVIGAIAAVSHPVPFMVSSPRVRSDGNYIALTLKRALSYLKALQGYNETISIYYMDHEGLDVADTVKAARESAGQEGLQLIVEEASTFSELVEKAYQKSIKLLG